MAPEAMGMRVHIGTSGWVYAHWKGVFYPDGLPQSRWLEFYGQHFATVELNNSFYQLPSEKSFTAWRQRTPAGFVYAVKVSRLITHFRRMRNTEEALGNFLSRARILGDKLGPLLYQLPPNMTRNEVLLESFLETLPADLCHVFEFRNESWFDEGVYGLLRKHNVGFCIYDMPGSTTPLVVTADFAYIRFHGGDAMYGSCYTADELDEWAERIERLGQGLRSFYIYFNNDAEAFAVANARTLATRLRLDL